MNRRLLLLPILTLAIVAVMLAFSRPETTAVAEEGAPEFLSQSGCKKCHFKQWRGWKKTVHYKALDILKPGERAEAKAKFGLDANKDYTTDPKCLKCHTTGYGQPGGYPAYKETFDEAEQKLAKNNAGVGCEACHGAGSKYAPYKKEHEDFKHADVVPLGLKVPITADNCTGCHNSESPTASEDYKFDFEKMSKQSTAIHEHTQMKHDHK